MIPKVLHRIWLGDPIPEPYNHGAEWERLHPDWDLRLWRDDDLKRGEWATRRLLDQAERFAPGDHVRFRVDVARLEILATHGGIYVDCDAVPLRPLDPLLDRQAFVAETPNKPGTATNAVMGATPGHPYIKALCEGLHDRAEAMAGRRVVESVGGFYLTDVLPAFADVELLPWWWFASRSIAGRRKGATHDPRNVREGFVRHEYQNSRRG